ncbi:unnamed protein product [Clonostachys rosea f. rosea IK726]|nr:unnamed protein product [Clonostachys rosea f. rosea IK726]
MLYTSFVARALAAFSILTAPVLGGTVNIPPELDARSAAKDVDIKWWTTLECKRSEHANGYNSGDCLNVEQRTAASMQRRKQTSCKMIRYEGKKCTGYSERGLNLHDCFSVKGSRWKSLKVQC